MKGMRRVRGPLLCAVVLLVVAAGCSNDVTDLSFGKPPAVKQGSGSQGPALPGNLDGVAQGGVPGQTTTTVPVIGPGSASIIGTVFGPNGPIGGATVEADRVVGNQAAKTTVTTAADGSFVVGSVLGGRYRVRAWQAPALAVTQPQIFFLGSTESHQLTLHLDAFNGPDVADSVNPAGLVVGEKANLVVQVTNPTVGNDGVVRDQPDPGVQVTLTDGPTWTVYSNNPLTTGSDGRALFQIGCSSAGGNSLAVEIGSGSPQPLSVPDCVEPAPPTTQCSPGSGTGGSGGFPADTSTTQPNGGC